MCDTVPVNRWRKAEVILLFLATIGALWFGYEQRKFNENQDDFNKAQQEIAKQMRDIARYQVADDVDPRLALKGNICARNKDGDYPESCSKDELKLEICPDRGVDRIESIEVVTIAQRFANNPLEDGQSTPSEYFRLIWFDEDKDIPTILNRSSDEDCIDISDEIETAVRKFEAFNSYFRTTDSFPYVERYSLRLRYIPWGKNKETTGYAETSFGELVDLLSNAKQKERVLDVVASEVPFCLIDINNKGSNTVASPKTHAIITNLENECRSKQNEETEQHASEEKGKN